MELRNGLKNDIAKYKLWNKIQTTCKGAFVVQKLVQALIDKIAKGKPFADDDELYLYIVVLGATVFAIAVHIVLFFILLRANVYFLVIFNAISVSLYCGTVLVVVKRRAYRLAVIPGWWKHIRTRQTQTCLQEFTTAHMQKSLLQYSPMKRRAAVGAWLCWM